MASRGVAAVLNAILWGSGNLYLKRGSYSVAILLAHLILYYYTVISASIVFTPILILGSLYFAIDGYKSTRTESLKSSPKTSGVGGTICDNCGAKLPSKGKFCPECGTARASA